MVNLGWYGCHHCHGRGIHIILRSGMVLSALFTIGRILKTPSPVKLLSILCILPTLASTIKFLCITRPKVHFADYRFGEELRYIFTGREPDRPIRDTHLLSNDISRPEQPTVGKLYDQVAVSVLPTCQPSRSPELGYEDEREQDMRCSACGATPVNAGWNRG